MGKTYQTKRLLLRESEPELAGAVAEYFTRNREFLRETEPERSPEFFTEDYQRKALEREKSDREAGSGYRLWLSPRDTPGRVIGMIALNNIVMGAFQSCYLAYRLDRDHLNQGLMTEAGGLLIRIAFGELGLHRIEGNIMPRNRRSLRVVEKLGFVNEGLSPKYLKINGVWEDHIHMVLRNQRMEQEEE